MEEFNEVLEQKEKSNIFSTIIKIITFNNYRNKYKRGMKINEIKQQRGKFYLQERHGNIFVVCDGYAIYKAKSTDTSEYILKVLEDARNTSLEYIKLKNNA